MIGFLHGLCAMQKSLGVRFPDVDVEMLSPLEKRCLELLRLGEQF